VVIPAEEGAIKIEGAEAVTLTEEVEEEDIPTVEVFICIFNYVFDLKIRI
jgi:hypothetical protein